MTVHAVSLCICNISYIGCSSCDLRRIRSVREWLDAEFYHVSDHVGVINNNFHRLFFAKITELFEHLVSSSEIQVTLHLCIIEAHAHQHVLSVASVFLVKEMRVGRSTYRHAVIVCCLYEKFIDNTDVIRIHRNSTRI